MASRPLLLLSIIAIVASNAQNLDTNTIDEDGRVEEESSPFLDVASSLLQNTNAGDLGNMVSSLLQSQGGKQLGSMLLGAATQNNGQAAGQILSGIGAMLGQSNAGAALDPSLLGNVLGMLADQGDKKKQEGPDLGAFMNLAGQFLGSAGGSENAKQEGPALGAFVNLAGQFLGNAANNVDQKKNSKQDGPDLGAFVNLAGQFLGNVGNNQEGPDLASLAGQFFGASNGDARQAPDFGAFANMAGEFLGNVASQADESKQTGPDLSTVANLASRYIGDPSMNLENSMGLLPSILQTISSFTGPEALRREKEHSGHAWLIPPLVEKIHVLFDHLSHSELGRAIWKKSGFEKLYNMFAVDGKFSVSKFFDMLENHSFRRYWIKLVTEKVTNVIALVSDPLTYKQYLLTGTSLLNSFLKTQNFPKSTHFDSTKPTETLTNLINYASSKFLNYKPNARQYVQPLVKYLQDIITMAQEKGILRKKGIDSKELSSKLTDTINLEIIEPVVRVYRAYRFAKKVPQCDKYVMCLVNQKHPHEVTSLPGLKTFLSKSTSVFGSWFLSSHTGSSFLSLYSVIMDDDNCNIRFHEACNDFHVEEIKVTTEYEHNEL